LFIKLLLSGCKNEKRGGLHNNDDFIGTMKTESASFSIRDSIRFNKNYTCDFFWIDINIIFSRTGDRVYKIINV
jgi:hypothetical protein